MNETQLKTFALNMAVESFGTTAANSEEIVQRAQAFYDFLKPKSVVGA